MSVDTNQIGPETTSVQVFPLTSAQRGLWISEQILSDPTAYAVSEVTHLSGPIDSATWLLAATAALEQFPALRMRLVMPDDLSKEFESAGDAAIEHPDAGVPVVQCDGPPVLPDLLDLRSHTDPHAAADRWIQEALSVPMDPFQSVVSHATLILTGENTAKWFLRIHHIAVDGYAFSLISRALADEYTRRVASTQHSSAAQPDAVTPSRAHSLYAEAISELLSYPDSAQAQQDREFWAAQVPVHAPVALAEASSSVQAQKLRISAPTRRTQPTLFIAALALLSGAVTGKNEATIGVHVMNRQSKALLRAGCTSQNLVVLRVPLHAEQSVGELLSTVEDQWHSARAHQQYRHEDLRVDRAVETGAPLYDVSLNMVPFAQSLKYGPVTGFSEPVWDGPSEGMNLDVRTTAAGHDELHLTIPTGSLTTASLRGHGEVLGTILATLARATDPTQSQARDVLLRDIPLVSEPHAGLLAGADSLTASHALQRQNVPRNQTWMIGALNRPGGALSLRSHDLDSDSFHIALVAPDRALSRQSAAAEANKLARLLRAQRVGPDQRVVIFVPRSHWGIVAPVAVMESGAAYIPCDDEWPIARVQSIIAASSPSLILTTQELATSLHHNPGEADPIPEVLILDAQSTRHQLDELSGTALTDHDRERPVRGSDPAYVLFTSGSTGTPKGVVVHHSNLGNYAQTVQELYLPQEVSAAGMPPGHAITCVHQHSFAFDSGLSPFVTFMAGHRILLPSYDQLRVPDQHVAYLRTHQPDMIDISPAVLEELLALGLTLGEEVSALDLDVPHPTPSQGRQAQRRILTSVFIGGDACSSALWTTLHAAARRGIFAANVYGPTENTVDSTVAWIGEHIVPTIGRALPRQRADVRDAWQRPLPVGIPGELWVSGPSVAAGYLGRDDLTAERFITVDGDVRSYRTGDRVRREPDGTLTFLGRTDHQLSLRGVRIEAGEVEAALLQLPGVTQAVVVIRDDGAGARLVAYAVAPEADPPGTASRKGTTSLESSGDPDSAGSAERAALDFLRERLPSSFVPSALVFIDQLPLTDRGKIDRSRLPAPSVAVGSGIEWSQFDQTQRLVARIYSDLLDVPAQALRGDSHLFALGGHSLTAARVVGRLGEAGYSGVRLRDIFASPTVSELAARLVELETGPGTSSSAETSTSADTSSTRTSGARSIQASDSNSSTTSETSGAYSMTDAQRSLWFIEQAEGPSGLYAIPAVLRVAGHLDLAAFEQALTRTVRTHLSLRCSYPDRGDGTPAPARWDDAAVSEQTRLISVDVDPCAENLGALVDSTIDITRSLPVRVFVAQSDSEQAIILVIHHIAADGASLGPIMDTLSAEYQRAIRASATIPAGSGTDAGRRVSSEIEIPRSTAPRPRGYLAADVEWWQARLAGMPEAIDLPLDRPRPVDRDHIGDEYLLPLSPDVCAALNKLTSERSTTTFMVFQAVLATLLSRCGGGDDIPIGTISSGGSMPSDEVTVGFLANTLVTRTDVSGNPTFAELINDVRESTLEALERADVPFDAVVGALNPPRSTKLHPLFQVMLVAQNGDGASFSAGPDGPSTSLRVEGNRTAKFDLTCEICWDSAADEFSGSGREPGITVRWEYASDVFDRDTVADIARWFATLVEQAVTEPDSRVWSRPLDERAVDAAYAEAQRMLAYREQNEQNDSANQATPLGQDTLAGAVNTALEQYAQATALVDVLPDGTRVTSTYAQLNQASQRIRDALWSVGVRAGDLVALMMPRSAEQVTAILGVLRAGGAYVPLDPDYPVDRLANAVEDAKPTVLLHNITDGLPTEFTQAAPGLRVLSLHDLPAGTTTNPAPESPNLNDLTGQSPAYVIFTSGSTGRPKGVVVPQSNVLRLLRSTEHWFGFDGTDVWTLFHSYAFDFTVWEMYGALLYGGTLVVVPTTLSRSPGEFLELLREERVTVLNQTPSAFNQLVRADRTAGGNPGLALRTIVLGGEAMDLATVHTWFERHRPGAPDVINMYGITETTVHVTYQRVDEHLQGWSPVGQPIPDLSVYLLDAAGHPVPDGVVGEIYVGGAGVATGYLGRDDLTAQRFVPDPYASAQAAALAAPAPAPAIPRPAATPDSKHPRMYRSGDLAVRTRNGLLDFRGRADRQVQLRGFRIELGEVEAAATVLDEVSSAYATVVKVQEGDERLILYVAGPDPATADPVSLRQLVSTRLPAQSAPATVVVVDRMPLTVNGKLDAAALPAPALPRTQGRSPSTPTEKLVCTIFAEVLGLAHCSADDSFFDLGGHSMLAVSLVARVRAATGSSLRVGTMLSAPTPALLAAHLDGEQVAEHDAELRVALPLRAGSGPGVFCIHPAGGLSWCYAGLPKHLASHIPVHGLQARGVLDSASQPRSLAAMADDYIEEILKIQPEGPYHLVGWSLGGMVAHVMAARLQQRGLQVGTVALLDAYPSEAESGVGEPPLEDAISAVLAMAGLDDNVLGGQSPSVDALARILAERSSPMAGLPDEVLSALVRTYRNTARILREYSHESFEGDVLFFRAARAGIGPDHDPNEWAPYVDGQLRIIDVDCTHREMTQPGPLAEIGALLNTEIS